MCAVVSAYCQEKGCPRVKDGLLLKTADVYDGPPEELAQLKPDVSRGLGGHAYASWDVGYVYDQGRTVFLICQYPDSKPTVKVNVKERVKTCIFRGGTKAKSAELACK